MLRYFSSYLEQQLQQPQQETPTNQVPSQLDARRLIVAIIQSFVTIIERIKGLHYWSEDGWSSLDPGNSCHHPETEPADCNSTPSSDRSSMLSTHRNFMPSRDCSLVCVSSSDLNSAATTRSWNSVVIFADFHSTPHPLADICANLQVCNVIVFLFSSPILFHFIFIFIIYFHLIYLTLQKYLAQADDAAIRGDLHTQLELQKCYTSMQHILEHVLVATTGVNICF